MPCLGAFLADSQTVDLETGFDPLWLHSALRRSMPMGLRHSVAFRFLLSMPSLAVECG